MYKYKTTYITDIILFLLSFSTHYAQKNNFIIMEIIEYYLHNYTNKYIFNTTHSPGLFILFYYLPINKVLLLYILKSMAIVILNRIFNYKKHNYNSFIVSLYLLCSTNNNVDNSIDNNIDFSVLNSYKNINAFYSTIFKHSYFSNNYILNIINSSINEISYTFVYMSMYSLLLNHYVLCFIILGVAIAINLHCSLFIIPIGIYCTYNMYIYILDRNNTIYIYKLLYPLLTISVVISFYILHINMSANRYYAVLDKRCDYSLRYKADANSSDIEPVDKYLMDRSLITIVNERTQLYLKSDKNKTVGSGQQRVFAGSKDENSIWRIFKVYIDNKEENSDKIEDSSKSKEDGDKKENNNENEYINERDKNDVTNNTKDNKEFSSSDYIVSGQNKPVIVNEIEEKIFIQNNDLIKLVHIPTMEFLHSHTEKLDKNFYETTCYGKKCDIIDCKGECSNSDYCIEITDDNDFWRIKIEESNDSDTTEERDKYIKARGTKITLQHHVTGTHLGFRLLDVNSDSDSENIHQNENENDYKSANNINNNISYKRKYNDQKIEVSNSLESIKSSRYFYIEDNKNDLINLKIIYEKEKYEYKNNNQQKLERIRVLRKRYNAKSLKYPSLHLHNKIIEFYHHIQSTNPYTKIPQNNTVEPYKMIIEYPSLIIFPLFLILNYIIYKRYYEYKENNNIKDIKDKTESKGDKMSNKRSVKKIITINSIIKEIIHRTHNNYNYYLLTILLSTYIPYFLTTRRYNIIFYNHIKIISNIILYSFLL